MSTTARQRAATPKAAPAPVNLCLNDEALWDWCHAFMIQTGGAEWAIDGLILLLWNVGQRESGHSLAEALIHRLYAYSNDSWERQEDYMRSLSGKQYGEDIPVEPPPP